MTLTYTGQEAFNLIKTILPNTNQTIALCKATIKEASENQNCTPKEAYMRILNNGCKPLTAIYMFVALYQIEGEANNQNTTIINAITLLEDEKKQLANQLFILEQSNTFPDKASLRNVYLDQLAFKDRQIQQHLNTFNVINPKHSNQQPNR